MKLIPEDRTLTRFNFSFIDDDVFFEWGIIISWKK